VIFIASHDVVCSYALLTVKYATLETVRSLGTFFLAVPTFHLAASTLFYCQHINQAIQIKTGWKIFQIATFRNSANGLTIWASNGVAAMALPMPLFQAVQTETVQAWQMFGIVKYVATHRARHFFTEIMEQRFDIHVVF